MDKKVYLCNRVVRCSKAQHTSEFALSLNRYHKIETLLFYSDTQLDTVFLTIRGKDKKQEKVFIRKEMFLFNNLPGLYFFPAGEACVIRILLTTPAAMAKNMANNKQACARCPSANIRNNKATNVVPKV